MIRTTRNYTGLSFLAQFIPQNLCFFFRAETFRRYLSGFEIIQNVNRWHPYILYLCRGYIRLDLSDQASLLEAARATGRLSERLGRERAKLANMRLGLDQLIPAVFLAINTSHPSRGSPRILLQRGGERSQLRDVGGGWLCRLGHDKLPALWLLVLIDDTGDAGQPAWDYPILSSVSFVNQSALNARAERDFIHAGIMPNAVFDPSHPDKSLIGADPVSKILADLSLDGFGMHLLDLCQNVRPCWSTLPFRSQILPTDD